MTDWTEKHRPRTLAEVRGNDTARDALREWAETWPDHREPVICHGPPGVGKTSAAHALAADMGWDVMELNASDARTGDVVRRVAGGAASNQSLRTVTADADDPETGRQLLVLDEADNLHGNADRGGAGAMTEVVKAAAQPVVLVANDYYEMSRGLRNACREIEFRAVAARSIVPALRDICRQEGIEFDEAALERIAEADDGDLRSAVRDLQAAADGKERVTVEDVATGERDRTLGVFEFLDEVLKEADAEAALQSAYDTDETPDDLTKWVEHNLPKVYEGAELARAYGHVANANRWLGRVRATQEYGYWRYATDALAAGVAAARDEPKGGWTRFGRPQFWNSRTDAAESAVRAIAESHGTDVATARREVLPFLSALTHHCKPRDLTVRMAAHYGFDEAEVSFVTGSGESTNKVESIVADAERRREETMADNVGSAFAPGPDRSGDGTDGRDGGADERGDENGESETERTDATDAEDPEDEDQSGLSDFL